ncbi:MAG: hypothetical protein WB791_06155 [Waddliaceae bacterium]
MPVSSYSQYQDPETGETVHVPQLFPHAVSCGGVSSSEIADWVNSGLIPKDIYEKEVESQKKSKELHDKLMQGEEIPSHELKQNPSGIIEFIIKNKASIYGENVLKKIFSNLIASDPSIVWLSFIKEAITSIASIDPLPIHFSVARKYLKEKHEIEEYPAIDALARALVEHCRQIKKFRTLNHPIFDKITITPRDLKMEFEEKDEILSLDFEFIKYIKQFGKKGKERGKEVENNSKEIYLNYKENNFHEEIRPLLWSLWVVDIKRKGQISGFLKVLVDISWEFNCASLWNRQNKQSAAITKPVIENIKPILSPKKNTKLINSDAGIICLNEEGKQLFTVPVIDSEMITLIQKGVKDLSTLTGHRMLRWEIKTGFEKWASGDPDFRVIKIEGGYSHIADAAGCASPREIAKVKSILHVQAHGIFVFHDGSRGNMLTLRVHERYNNNEPSKISIVLGDMLLPGHIFSIGRRDRRLIPIGELPPFYGSKNTYAQQAHLQLLVFEEFSNQSDKLAKDGFIIITEEKWKEMAIESGLSPDKLEPVITHWCQPDLFRNFLDRQGNEYCLTSFYKRERQFLISQGEQRLINSKRGKASARKKSK